VARGRRWMRMRWVKCLTDALPRRIIHVGLDAPTTHRCTSPTEAKQRLRDAIQACFNFSDSLTLQVYRAHHFRLFPFSARTFPFL